MYTFVEKDENISGACTNFLRGGGIRKSSVPDTTVLDTLGDLSIKNIIVRTRYYRTRYGRRSKPSGTLSSVPDTTIPH